MIHYLKGKVTEINGNKITVENGGIGFELFVLGRDEYILSTEVKIYVFNSISQNDGEISLYGFLDEQDLLIYRKLITISGIGNKIAYSILNKIKGIDLVYLIKTNDIAGLKEIGPIGSKANMIYYTLQNKLNDIGPNLFFYENVFKALKKLGYKRDLILNAIYKIEPGLDEEVALKNCIRIMNQ